MKARILMTAAVVLLLASAAQAQIVVYSAPVTTYYGTTIAAVPVQTVVRPRRAVTTFYAPAAIAIPATTVYYSPSVSATRTTTYYSSVSSMPVATVALNGAKNAGILAAQILALHDTSIAGKLEAFKNYQDDIVMESVKNVKTLGFRNEFD